MNSLLKITKDDWKRLTPNQFEELCTDLLKHIGFENVKHFGASGDKGRDIICDKTITLGQGITERYSYIIQCKHYLNGLGKHDLLNDLAAAKEHKFDNWWLMTTAKLTPNLVDWLGQISRSDNYPFKINYMDQKSLEDLLSQFIQILARYFPDKVEAADLAQEEAMELMGKGQYQEACRILKEKDDGINPRFPYLLACCSSMIASQSKANREKNSLHAFEYLSEASKRDYIAYGTKKFGWPESKCLFEIHRDPELQCIKELDAKQFDRIFPKPKEKHLGGGGCFPLHTLVKCSIDKATPIAYILPCEKVVTLISKSNIFHSRVENVYKTIVHNTIIINSDMETSFDQPFHTISGWCRADDLKVGDLVTTVDGPRLVSSVEYKEGDTEVYHLTLYNRNGQFYANRYLVHNKMR